MLLAACGGGSGGNSASEAQAVPVALSEATLVVPAETLPAAAATMLAEPAFHVAPVLLEEPDDLDESDNAASASIKPHVQAVPSEQAAMATRHLTVDALQTARRMQPRMTLPLNPDGSVAPLAASTAVSTYTPAQIRAAYGLPALPAAGAALSAAQAAQLGAGQTIYIVDAQHDPNVVAELNAFNQKFGLPACTSRTIAAGTALPLAAASTSGCEFAVAYSSASGTLTNTAPAYDSGWATEITLDVQWAHATAPLARIVLIEAPDASLNSLIGAVRLANTMGPGVVSMSFGANEGSWTSSVDAAFTGAGMSYLAATGDSGAAVSWPAVSANVLAVGGTSLTYTGSGARRETGWSGTGGGVSAYVPTPAYQKSAVPGVGGLASRGVADVAFNADPATGQFVAVIQPGSSAVNWISAGGTSLSTPQWAGLVAVANAMRAQAGKPALGAPHIALYGQIGAIPGSYAAAFADVTTGADGSCASCTARTGYDHLTGLGTPNAAALLSALGGSSASAPPTAPVVTAAAISGKVGTPLSFSVTVSAANPVTYTLSGAPSGMSINTSGVVSWASPVAGSYAVTVVARDSKTALSGQAVYSVKIDPPTAPTVASASINATAGTPLSFNVAVTASNAVSYTLAGAPTGMTISTSGVLSWANPLVGSYTVTVRAKDSKTGLTGQGVIKLTVAAPVAGPVIKAPPLTGVAGVPLSGTISVSNPSGQSLSVTITGIPMGVTLALSGQSILLNWARPVTGGYTLTITAKDASGKTAQVTMPITITAK
ncbi:hypothetical protein GCM10025771_05780 [Niveibacterium umoris]